MCNRAILKLAARCRRCDGLTDVMLFTTGLETLHGEPSALEEGRRLEDATEILRKAEAAVAAAADVISLSLPHTGAQEELHDRQFVLQAEAQRLTDALDEQQRQVLVLQEEHAPLDVGEAPHVRRETQDHKDSSCAPPTTAVICIGSFKLIRHHDTSTSHTGFISMQQLQLEVQHKMCQCFPSMAGFLRSAQLVIEAKGQKITVSTQRLQPRAVSLAAIAAILA